MRQKPIMSWRLVPTLLHEGCHAIMDDMFGELPFWMVEGSADWLGEAPAWLQKADGLRNDQHARWVRLNRMRLNGNLPNLKAYLLSHEYEHWDQMFDSNIGMGYDIGWSVFDFFMKTHPQAMKFLEPWSTTAPCSAPAAAAMGAWKQPSSRPSTAIGRRHGVTGKRLAFWIKIKAAEAEKELLKLGKNSANCAFSSPIFTKTGCHPRRSPLFSRHPNPFGYYG